MHFKRSKLPQRKVALMNNQICAEVEEFLGEAVVFWVGWEEQRIKATCPLLLERYDSTHDFPPFYKDINLRN